MELDFNELSEFGYSAGGFFGGFDKIKIIKQDDSSFSLSYDNPHSEFCFYHNKPTNVEKDVVIEFIKSMYVTYLSKWENRYEDRGVMDGFSYDIKIKIGESNFEWSGYAKNPRNFPKFAKEVAGFAKENLSK